MEKIKILYLASNPQSTNRLQLDEEARLITQRLIASAYRDSLELITAWAVRPSELLELLNRHKPHIVHFSGHGKASGEIILVGDDGDPKPVSVAAIEHLFRTLRDNIRIVVFNACYSEQQANAINQFIDFVIGMNAPVSDQAAIAFAASFYSAIGFNRFIKESFEQGKTALELEGIPGSEIPVLLIRQGAKDRKLIDIPPRPINDKKVNGSRLLIQITLGMLLPPMACLLATIAYGSRFYLEGIWTSGAIESVITASTFIALFIFCVVLIVAGISQLGRSMIGQVTKFDIKGVLQSSKFVVCEAIDYLKAHPNWFEAIKNLPQILKPRINLQETDFTERLIAIVLSLVFPGLGLIRRGWIWFGIVAFVFTTVGYIAEFFPGLLMHILVIIISGLIEKKAKDSK